MSNPHLLKILAGLPAAFLMNAAVAGGSVPWQSWSDGVFQQARQEQRLVLVDLSAQWCTYCRKMDATTWQDSKVLAAVSKHYIPVKIVDEEDPELAARYRDYGRPAVLILDADGKEIMRRRGYMKPQWMEWMLQAVVQEQEGGKL